MKNVLVIGGSAFTGRVFSRQASQNGGFNLHVVNRGNHPMSYERVEQYKCDRRDPASIARLLPDITFDALVDFCAYEPGEIESIIDTLGDRIKQYIFFSTASVYIPDSGFLEESAPIPEPSDYGSDPVTAYVHKKITLERELIESCGAASVKMTSMCEPDPHARMPRYTILRPTFIYGPFNYAPRESYFIKLIAEKQVIPVPVDATSRFNFVYVVDVASALMACIGDERAYNGIYNLAGPEPVTYPLLMSEFERCNGGPFNTREISAAQADAERIPLPFPFVGDTLACGEKFARAFDFSYTPFTVGMEKTFKIFYELYSGQA